MEDIKKKRNYTKKIKTESIVPTENVVVPPSSSLTNNTEGELNTYKYTKHGAIRQSWIRDEALRMKQGNNDVIAIKVKEELLRIEKKKAKEDEKERLKQQMKNEKIRIREEKKAKIKLEKVDMRGKSEKAIAHGKKMGSKLQESLRKKYLKKEEERNKRFPDSSDSEEEEITTTRIIKKRGKSRTPDIDYRRLYEESIKNKIIPEEPKYQQRHVSPNIELARHLQQNMFRGII